MDREVLGKETNLLRGTSVVSKSEDLSPGRLARNRWNWNKPRPMVGNNDNLEIRRMMTLSLSLDTAVMNIVDAAYMMKEVKELIDNGLAEHLDVSERADEIVAVAS